MGIIVAMNIGICKWKQLLVFWEFGREDFKIGIVGRSVEFKIGRSLEFKIGISVNLVDLKIGRPASTVTTCSVDARVSE